MPRTGEPLCLSRSASAADGVMCCVDCGISRGARAGEVPAAAEMPVAGGMAMLVGVTTSNEVGADQLASAAICCAAGRVAFGAAGLAAGFVRVFGADGFLAVVPGVVEPGGVVDGGVVDGGVEVTCFTVWSMVVTTLSGEGTPGTDGTPGTEGTDGTDGTDGAGGRPVSAKATPPENRPPPERRQSASAPVETLTARRVIAVDVIWPAFRRTPCSTTIEVAVGDVVPARSSFELSRPNRTPVSRTSVSPRPRHAVRRRRVMVGGLPKWSAGGLGA